MTARTGDLRGAIALWREVLDDPRNDDAARAIAKRQIRGLLVRADVQDLDRAIAAYRGRFGRLPRELADLVRAGSFARFRSTPTASRTPTIRRPGR